MGIHGEQRLSYDVLVDPGAIRTFDDSSPDNALCLETRYAEDWVSQLEIRSHSIFKESRLSFTATRRIQWETMQMNFLGS